MKYTVLVRFLSGNVGYVRVRAGSPEDAASRAHTKPFVLAVEKVT